MILSTEIASLFCDDCWMPWDQDTNPLKLELEAQHAGWEFRGTEALCPECAQDREREEVLNAAERSWGEAMFGADGVSLS